MTRRLLAVPPLAGLVAVVAATAKGLYVSPDGVFYVGTARNWVAGRGLTPPPGLPSLDHFPPLFTVVLAAVGRLGMDPLTAARVVNTAAFAAVVALVGLVVLRQTGSVGAGVVASVMTVAAVDVLTLSASALSEPLFILLAVAGLVALAASLDRGSVGLLVTAGALVAAAFLTRYAGVALVVACVGVLLWRRRWVPGAAFAAATVAPVALWLAWAGGRGSSDRSLALHLFGAEYLGQAARPLSRWFVPWPPPPVGLVLAAAVVAGAVVLVRREGGVPTAPPSARPGVLATFTVVYLAVLLADRALTDATGRLDARFLAPLHVVAIVLVVPALYRRRLPAAAVALAGLLVVAQLADAVSWTVGGLTDDGVGRRGYTAAAWKRSPVMAQIAGTAGQTPVYSNAFDAIEFLTGEPARPVPAKVEYLTGRVNPAYQDELAAMRSALAGTGGYLAWFDAATFRRSFLPSRAELEAALPLQVVARDDVGTLYRLRQR